jgi:hypothetical protein
MCLLITKLSNSPVLAEHWIEDFYDFNSDGIGIMFAENNELVIKKILPKTEIEAIAFYQEYVKGKTCAIHFRMRTHGNIDLNNCHPYQVLNKKEHGIDLALMHNGILGTGNAKDLKMSDTWHYIQDYLKPMLSKNPDFAFTGAFKELISKHIGSGNKFVLMDNLGRMATINDTSGYYWGGLWLSNTYAWSAPTEISETFVKNHKQWKKEAKSAIEKYQYKGFKYGNSWQYDDYDWKGYNYSGKATKADLTEIALNDAENCIQDLIYLGFDELEALSIDDLENFLAVNQLQDVYNLYDNLYNEDITCSQFMDYIYNPSRHKHINVNKLSTITSKEKSQ